MRPLAARSFVAASFVLAGIASHAAADVQLPRIISDHMVLEAGKPANVWGWAEPNEEVTVNVAGQTKTTKADAKKNWSVKLDPLKAGKIGTMTVSGKNKLVVNDILAGEVWVCSGQSNMAMSVERSNDFDKEKAAADLPEIRQFKVVSSAMTSPQVDCQGEWTVCSPETVGKFTATGYFFGRELHKELKVPVGLINSSVGGTPIESWIDADAQRAKPELKGFFAWRDEAAKSFDPEAAKKNYERQKARWKDEAAKAKAEKKPVPRAPRDPIALKEKKGDIGGLYNGLIAPITRYTITGAIWYQGEANAHPGKSPYYGDQLSLLATDWRKQWGQGDFPVAWVQLPNFNRPGPYWPQVREGMMKALATPNTGMAIAIDVGDPKDIHPKNKQAVGYRLAQWALATVYGKNVVPSGPLFTGSEPQGDKIVVSFKYADGLTSRSDEVRGFEIAGSDQKFHPAKARIKGTTVVVSSPEVKQPVAVRYGWADNPEVSLYNGAGLPASPFRTDNWTFEEP